MKARLLALMLGVAGLLGAAERYRLADAPTLPAAGSGWWVEPSTKRLYATFPGAGLGGEMPVPLAVRMSGSYRQQPITLWEYDPDLRRRVPSWTTLNQYPMFGTLHFGYILPAASYNGYTEVATYVLDDGSVLRETDFRASTTSYTGLAGFFGFAKTTGFQVDSSNSAAVGTFTLADLGSLGAAVQGVNPTGFGTLAAQWKVMLTKDRARVHVLLPSLNVWVPVMWVDRFGHKVTFQWKRATSGLPAGITGVTSVRVMNRFAKGIQVQWAEYADTTTVRDLVRADAIGMDQPSFLVQGYPGYSTAQPANLPAGQTVSDYDDSVVVPPKQGGPMFRPTRIEVGSSQSLAVPAWVSGGLPIPSPVASTLVSTQAWILTYDSNQVVLATITSPQGAQTAFVHDYLGTSFPFSTSTTTYVSGGMRFWGVLSADTTAPGAATRHQTWGTTLATEGRIVATRDWFGDAPPLRETRYTYPTSGQQAGNGVPSAMEMRRLDTGVVIQRKANTTGTIFVDDTGTPVQTVTTTYPDPAHPGVTRVDVTGMNVSGVPTYQAVKAAGNKLLWDSQRTVVAVPELLDPGRITDRTEAFYEADGATPKEPRSRITYEYDQGATGGRGLLTQWLRQDLAGALSAVGEAMTYDAEGRVTRVETLPKYLPPEASSIFERISARSSTYAYDSATGALASLQTMYALPVGDASSGFLTRTFSAFDSLGRPQQLTDERGVVSTVAYDTFGRPTRQGRAGEPDTIFAYPTPLKRTSTRLGLTTAEERDGFGRTFIVTSPEGGRQETTFDALGRLATRRVVSGTGTSQPAAAYEYDLLDRPTLTLNPGGKGATKTLAYSLNPSDSTRLRTTGVVDPAGLNAQSLTDQNLLGQTVWSQDPLGNTTTAAFDALGNLARADLRDPAGRLQTRTFTFDALGRLIQRVEPETGTTVFTDFDALGNPTTVNEAVGTVDARTRTLAFDGLGRLVRQTNGTTDVLTYNFSGPTLVSASSLSGGTTVTQSFAYEPGTGRLTSETSTQADHTATLGYAFEPGTGRLATLTYPSGRVVRYGYDGLGRVTGVWQKPSASVAEVPVASVAFNQWGQRERLTFASGAYSNWSTKDYGTHLDQWTIGFTAGGLTDPANPRTYMVDTAERLSTAGEWSLVHDKGNRIIAASAPALAVNSAFDHDGFGNLTQHSSSGAGMPSPNNFTLSPLPADKMPTSTVSTDPLGSRTTGWAYSGTGDAKSFAVTTGSAQKVTLGWDGLGRLRSAALTGYTQSYDYAPSGLRVKLTDSGAAVNNRRYAYSAGGLLLSEFTANPTPAWKRDVIYLGGEAIAEVDATGTHELHNDHLGSPRIITLAATGKIEGRQAFGAYGERILTEGYLPLTGFTGHIQQDPTGLLYMRGRYYSVAWKRFINSDQGLDPKSWNQMAYVGGMPFTAKDPSGKMVCTTVYWHIETSWTDSEGVHIEAGPQQETTTCDSSGDSSGGDGGDSVGGGGSGSNPDFKNCEGLATIIGGNAKFINNPKFHGAWGDVITADSAAIIPSQFGFSSKDAMAPYISQISGQIYIPTYDGWGPAGWFPLFSEVKDRADDRGTRIKNNWSLSQFENAMINKVERLNGGNSALYIEIPGMSQIDTAWVKITVPASLPCPDGTSEKK